MYLETARRWVAELQASGKLTDLDSDALEKLAQEYAERLEEIYLEEVVRQMENAEKPRSSRGCSCTTAST